MPPHPARGVLNNTTIAADKMPRILFFIFSSSNFIF